MGLLLNVLEALNKLNDIIDDEDDDSYEDDNGDIVHVMSDGGSIRDIFMAKYLKSGEEWCPDCHIKMTNRGEYFECPECNFSITKEESENGEGHPTLESSYDDYDTYW